jgi:hypothetical protein
MLPVGLDPARVATLTAVVDRLVPADALGSSAGQLGVVEYINRTLARQHARFLPLYDEGLGQFDEISGGSFAALGTDDQDAALAAAEAGDLGATTQAFFERVRVHVMEGLFGDPAWGGNRDGGGWDLMGYPGPRAVWTFEEQQLDVAPLPVDVRSPTGGAS